MSIVCLQTWLSRHHPYKLCNLHPPWRWSSVSNISIASFSRYSFSRILQMIEKRQWCRKWRVLSWTIAPKVKGHSTQMHIRDLAIYYFVRFACMSEIKYSVSVLFFSQLFHAWRQLNAKMHKESTRASRPHRYSVHSSARRRTSDTHAVQAKGVVRMPSALDEHVMR